MARSKSRGFRPSSQMEAVASQAAAVRARLVEAQQAVARQEVTGSSAGDEVVIVVTGDFTVRSVKVDPTAAADVAALESHIQAALVSATQGINALRTGATGDVNLDELNLGGVPLS